MKNINRKIAVWTVALLSLATANATLAGDDKDAAKSADQARAGEAPACYNKASGIIGMEVKNQNDERLGKIRDVVFDLNTERVSYVVLGAKKGLLGSEEKYLAVPMSALRATGDGKYLILNADKDKVAAAAGFSLEAWPAVGSPSWGAEPFWQPDTQVPAVTDKSTDNYDNTKKKTDGFPSTPTPTPAGVPARTGAPVLTTPGDK